MNSAHGIYIHTIVEIASVYFRLIGPPHRQDTTASTCSCEDSFTGVEIRDGFVVVYVPYDEKLGLRAPVEDDEYGNDSSRSETFADMVRNLAKDNPNVIM